MSGAPYPRPASSKKVPVSKLSKEQAKARMVWKTGRPFMEAHHIISQQVLRKRGHSDLLWDTRNRLWLDRARHEQHTNCYRKIRWGELPPEAFEFAEEIGLTWWLERNYGQSEPK